MIYEILLNLKKSKHLYSCSMTIHHKGAVNDRRSLFGREVIDFSKSAIRFRGGETGYEEFSVPLEDVNEIVSNGKVVFRRKPRIKKVYPR